MNRRALLWSALAVIVTAPVHADTARSSAIEAAIARQLDAFRRDDGAAAFAVASPAIQAMFRDHANFLRMVAEAYPQVHRAEAHRLLRLEAGADGRLVQRVLLSGPRGTVVALYEMVEIDGVWRINGCTIERGSDA